MYCLRVLLTYLLLTANDYKIGTEIGLHTHKQTDRHTHTHRHTQYSRPGAKCIGLNLCISLDVKIDFMRT